MDEGTKARMPVDETVCKSLSRSRRTPQSSRSLPLSLSIGASRNRARSKENKSRIDD